MGREFALVSRDAAREAVRRERARVALFALLTGAVSGILVGAVAVAVVCYVG